jgi:hypothetical protein
MRKTKLTKEKPIKLRGILESDVPIKKGKRKMYLKKGETPCNGWRFV